MEVLMENLAEKELIALDHVKIKSEQKVNIPAGAKKLMTVTCQLLNPKVEVSQSEILVVGNLNTRLIFINEFDKYDSEDISEVFEKKVTVKGYDSICDVLARVELMKSEWKISDDKIDIDNSLMVHVWGVKSREMQVVGNLTGDVEVQKNEQLFLTFHSKLNDKFEISENIKLDNLCEGVLSVDVNPNLKDVVSASGKVNLKGVMMVNILCVKTVDGTSVPYNMNHEIDFAKSVAVNGLTDEDIVSGVVNTNNVKMHIENSNDGAILVLSCDISFDARTYCNRKFNMVTDAISFSKELTLQTTQLNCVEILPQVNTVVDIENNLNIASNSGYISHVVAVEGMCVNNLQVNVTDNKALLEGVLGVNLLLENEEHLITGEHFDVPFQTSVRVDNLDREYVVDASVVPLVVNAKARRGTELLIDARLCVTVQAETKKTVTVVNSLIEGQEKKDDGSAIQIYIIGEKENLWNLAKRTNLSCEALLQQNPNLENGCTPGERIVVYRHENVSL